MSVDLDGAVKPGHARAGGGLRMAGDDVAGVAFHDFSTGGKAGQLIRDKDWATTSLGARDRWPRSLNNYLRMILELPTAAIIFWGADHVQLYNDGYSVIMGPRHPRYLGATFGECWPEAYPTIHPWMQRVLGNGETVEVNRTLVPLTRYGFTEEAYFTFSFSPLRGDDGQIAGILQLVTEVTDAVLGERRASALRELSNQSAHATTTEDATRLATHVLARYTSDLAFCLLYTAEPQNRTRFALSGSTGLPLEGAAFPKQVDLESSSVLPELSEAVRARKPVLVENLAVRFGGLPAEAWPEPPTQAMVFPIAAADQQSIVAALVVGISPRLKLQGPYRDFLELVSAQLGTLMATARAYDDEKKRAEALAELDRAKTEFFGNVSHEFRTPLTLILGPLEDALADPACVLRGEGLRAVHRSALRLLRLVNSLLDFSRIEANRLTSSFEPVDLPMLTGGLAGSFQSLVESAGLKLVVDCPPFGEPVYVDPSQWEKIVLNLVSNAFKFTFEGQIAVRLRAFDRHVEFSVSDTGTGIPAEELPKIFDRFHRVQGARGRSFEGTGIGLALVRELVKQHGGEVRVESGMGEGSTFVVTLPRGTDHLPKDRVSPAANTRANALSPTAQLVAATYWSPSEGRAQADQGAAHRPNSEVVRADSTPASSAHILVADDNSDMREYLVRLLSTRWVVTAVSDGKAALESALERPPDLVLSDVMMPGVDGVGLLRALRADPRTSDVPVVLVSARAGEESVVAGLDTGADDYLIKPFSARELMSRVATHLEMARVRRVAANVAKELAETRASLLRDLQRKNDELEAYSYSVSHDLRAPLRAIDGFSQVLLEDHAVQLDAKGRALLERVRAAAKRMGELIDDLLKLSRIDRMHLRRQPVDLSGLARRIGQALSDAQPDRKVSLLVEKGLVADADPRLLEIVLENLIGNAWKFTARTASPRIEVGSDTKDGQTTFWVRDNGAGFDPTFAHRLFAPFQRLHSGDEFPGTGIGLATVRRVIERHGGRVWANGEIDGGATIFLTLSPPTRASVEPIAR